jgi:hypothetical protein
MGTGSAKVVEGGVMDNVHIDGIQMSGVQTPLFIKLGDRSRWNPNSAHVPGIIRNIAISHIQRRECFRNDQFDHRFPQLLCSERASERYFLHESWRGERGGYFTGDPGEADRVPGKCDVRTLSAAYGLYIRHAKQIILQNVKLGFMAPDVRPALWMEDVEGMTATGLQMKPPSNGKHYARIVQSSGIRLPRE